MERRRYLKGLRDIFLYGIQANAKLVLLQLLEKHMTGLFKS